MASFLDKIKVNTAMDQRTKFDLGCDHITTSNWMQFTPVYNKEMVPKEKIDVNVETFTRMLPLNYPTFGRANIHNSAFFVPYRTVFPGWNDFITDAVHINSGNAQAAIVNTVPTFDNATFITAFFNTNSNYATVVSGSNPVDYSVNIGGQQGVVTDYKLTNLGRQIMKILYSLGYTFKMDDNDTTDIYSALPLLSVVKIYCDWYYPSAYADRQDYQSLLSLTKLDNNSQARVLTATNLNTIFSMIGFVNYDSDYFTSAWDNPVGPNSGNYSVFTISDSSRVNVVNSSTGTTGISGQVTNDPSSTTGSNDSNGTPSFGRKGVAGYATVTQYMIDSLKKLTDYMKRHQLVGAKAIDRYLARFGVQLSDDKMDRSLNLGRQMIQIQIGDVMSTSDTQGAALGDYAGKGLGYGQGHFDFESDEYGQFVIISSIVPAVGYYQGVDRNVLHTTKLDFWTPEFDNLGTQPILADELYISTNVQSGFSSANGTIFGWTPRYAEYKVARDRVTGDFRYDSMNTGDDAWYLMRKFDDTSFQGIQSVVHSPDFVQGTDWSQYNRIFNTGNSNSDAFKMIYHFEIGDYAPMHSLFDTYEFEDKGNSVVEDVNGVKVN